MIVSDGDRLVDCECNVVRLKKCTTTTILFVSLCDCDVGDGGYQLNSLDCQCNVVKLKKMWWTLSLCDCE